MQPVAEPFRDAQVAPPGLAVAWYAVIELPPLNVGADQESVADPIPGNPVTSLGAFGTVKGVTGSEGDDGSDDPASLVATTVKV